MTTDAGMTQKPPVSFGDTNYWKLPYEERRPIREAWEVKKKAYEKTFLGKLDTWFNWRFRGWLSDKIAPKGWNNE